MDFLSAGQHEAGGEEEHKADPMKLRAMGGESERGARRAPFIWHSDTKQPQPPCCLLPVGSPRRRADPPESSPQVRRPAQDVAELTPAKTAHPCLRAPKEPRSREPTSSRARHPCWPWPTTSTRHGCGPCCGPRCTTTRGLGAGPSASSAGPRTNSASETGTLCLHRDDLYYCGPASKEIFESVSSSKK